MSVSVTASLITKESPVSEEHLKKLVSQHAESELTTLILTDLRKNSSKFKFLVHTTELASPLSVEADLDISSKFGAVWDTEKDGYINLKIGDDDGNTTLVSVYWLYVG